MFFNFLTPLLLLFVLALIFDVSFNIRRLVGIAEKIWRKLSEINEALSRK